MSQTAIDERLADEIEALRAILLDDELTITETDSGKPQEIETLIFPSTGEDELSQYVCIKLIVKLLPGYPDVSPTINLKNPRGLDENTIKEIQQDLNSKCQELIGQPVVFELIEIIKEHLTKSNLPTGQCVICLYGFREQDQFVKTECFHYFHSHCLATHLATAEDYYNEEQDKLPQWQRNTSNGFQAFCPVCREPITVDIKSLQVAPPPADLELSTEFSVTAELLEMQCKMQELFLHQQKRGGIIDLEAEEVKLLVTTQDLSGNNEQASVSGHGNSSSGNSINKRSNHSNSNENYNHHRSNHRGHYSKKDAAFR